MPIQQHCQFLNAVRWLCVGCLISTYLNDLCAAQLSPATVTNYTLSLN
ncbi:hypothetical protein [Hymenobacter cellulosivorans]|uniref:Uncharacterized protein n=1 Tax=Hymenobacter cellulosivorans TaxID=2932249 RepID=A0ABY4F6H8_9BACT|nr:hypothetical protein [Hymenobacter cellulosivorans]UOQ51717.1 hypothetical protein MUN80_18370 [Hymenobacter cellulosivorans]